MLSGKLGLEKKGGNLGYAAVIHVSLWLALLLSSSGCVNAKVNNQHNSTLDRKMVMAIIVEEANAQNFDPALALAIAQVESNFNPSAESHAGARGVMQIMPKTAREEFGLNAALMFDARTNIRTGITFMKQLLQRYGDIKFSLSHYNGGSRVMKKDGTFQVIPATKNYVAKVLAVRPSFKGYLKDKYLVDQPELLFAGLVKHNSASLSYRKTKIAAKEEMLQFKQQFKQQSKQRVSVGFRENVAQLKVNANKRAQVLGWESVYPN